MRASRRKPKNLVQAGDKTPSMVYRRAEIGKIPGPVNNDGEIALSIHRERHSRAVKDCEARRALWLSEEQEVES